MTWYYNNFSQLIASEMYGDSDENVHIDNWDSKG